MKFAQRTHWPTESNPLAKREQEYRKSGKKLIDLTQSNPTRAGLTLPAEAILGALADEKNLCYDPDPKGLLEAREAVCEYYAKKGIEVSPDQVFLTSSTSEAYHFLLTLLCDAGDQVLVPKPSYPLLEYLTALRDLELVRYPLAYGSRWTLSLAALTSHLTTRSKALIFVNPNNPTGNFLSSGEIASVATLCRDRKLAIISDEVFFDFGYGNGGRKGSSLAGNAETLTFTLGGVSKMLGLPQMKLSWIVVSGPKPDVESASARLDVISDTFLSVNTPSQRALKTWMSHQESIHRKILERIEDNRGFLEAQLAPCADVQVLASEGGWYAVIESNRSMNDENLAMDLLERCGVLTHPGYFFDFDEGHFLVVSMLPPTSLFREAVEKMAAYFSNKNETWPVDKASQTR